MASNRKDALTIARRYATAIFSQALEAKKESDVVADFVALAEAIRGSAPLARALASPLVPREEKSAVLSALAKSAEKLTQRALEVIGDAGRGELLPDIADALEATLREHRGELVAVVTSARPLPAATQKQIKEAIAKATGKPVEVELAENEALLGGLTVQLGSLKLDASLSGALSQLRSAMSAAH